jgi:enamine deaminase RidA (YjgF/YER057c/UK114 family)
MLKNRLKELNIELPTPTAPLAAYTPARIHNNLIYLSGQLPLKNGNLMLTGQMTPGKSIDEAKEAMAQCFLNGLAAASLVCDPDKIKGVLRLGAFVSSSADFHSHHLVANGASELAQKIFGEAGVHVRSAVGVSSLPLDSTVELEIIFETL